MRRALLSAFLSVCLVVAPPAFALGPLERNQPAVERGMAAYRDGKYEEALSAFEEAKRAMPDKAAVEFDRGNALYKLDRLEDAKQAYHQAAELDKDGSLKPRDYYNLGNAWAAMGDNREAISSYRRALTLDPADEEARHNLEVLLRRIPPKKPAPDGGTPDGGSSDGGADAGRPDAGRPGNRDGGMDGGAPPSDGGQPDGGRPDGGGGDGGSKRQDGGSGDAGSDAGSPSGGEPQRADGGSDPNSPDAGEGEQQEAQNPDEGEPDAGMAARLSKRDAERILDAMKRDERNLQLWRFQRKTKPVKQNEKDW